MKLLAFLALGAGLALATSLQAEVVLKDDSGAEIRLREPAKRIVTLAPHAAESLFAAGGGSKLVGTVEYSDYPPEAKKIPRVGGYSRIDLEAVVALKPDLVIAWSSGNNTGQVDKLKALGLTVYLFQPNKMEDVAGQIEQLGRMAGSEDIAGPAAERFRKRLEALRNANLGKPKVRVFYQIWKSPLTTVGGPQIISDAIRLCGGENIFGSLKQMAPTVSVEAVLEADPEAIVATGMGDARPEWLSDWDKWSRMTAVKRGNLFHINPDIMQRHTPRILDGTEKLCGLFDMVRTRRRGI